MRQKWFDARTGQETGHTDSGDVSERGGSLVKHVGAALRTAADTIEAIVHPSNAELAAPLNRGVGDKDRSMAAGHLILNKEHNDPSAEANKIEQHEDAHPRRFDMHTMPPVSQPPEQRGGGGTWPPPGIMSPEDFLHSQQKPKPYTGGGLNTIPGGSPGPSGGGPMPPKFGEPPMSQPPVAIGGGVLGRAMPPTPGPSAGSATPNDSLARKVMPPQPMPITPMQAFDAHKGGKGGVRVQKPMSKSRVSMFGGKESGHEAEYHPTGGKSAFDADAAPKKKRKKATMEQDDMGSTTHPGAQKQKPTGPSMPPYQSPPIEDLGGGLAPPSFGGNAGPAPGTGPIGSPAPPIGHPVQTNMGGKFMSDAAPAPGSQGSYQEQGSGYTDAMQDHDGIAEEGTKDGNPRYDARRK